MTRYERLTELRDRVGQEVGVSDWIAIDQARIDRFADATGDHQWIHVDPMRAAAGPFGATVAHGFLTLSLLPLMAQQAMEIADTRMGINYGLDRVRFPAPVRVGGRLRGRFVLLGFEPLAAVEGVSGPGAQLAMECTMELEGSAKPACVARMLSRRHT
jgi:acyl dehydratase